MLFYIISNLICNGFNSISISKRQLNFGKAITGFVLLCIVSILSVIFRLLHCHKVGNNFYHFYFAYEQCYTHTYIISLIVLFVIVLMFGMLFIKIKSMGNMFNI